MSHRSMSRDRADTHVAYPWSLRSLAALAGVLSGSLAMSANGQVECTVLYSLPPPVASNSISPATFGAPITPEHTVGYLDSRATLWTARGVTPLNPPWASTSTAQGTCGTEQVGTATRAGVVRAVRWNGSAASIVDLHPTGYYMSIAVATNGTQQAGYAFVRIDWVGYAHAMLWSGTAASAVDLHPSGFAMSWIRAIDATHQGGAAGPDSAPSNMHAMVWSGTAASAVDLHPAGFFESDIMAISSTQQVGFAAGPATDGMRHATVWTGTAESAVDLHPPTFTNSSALGTAGVRQVGYAYRSSASGQGSGKHAFLWSGYAASAIDLHTFVPATLRQSVATLVTGDEIYGYALDAAGNYHVVKWRLLPEAPCPSCVADFDQDGAVGAGDLGAFMQAYERGESCADADLSGGIDASDVAAFFALYEIGGCE